MNDLTHRVEDINNIGRIYRIIKYLLISKNVSLLILLNTAEAPA
jgi:hypothetical protein